MKQMLFLGATIRDMMYGNFASFFIDKSSNTHRKILQYS